MIDIRKHPWYLFIIIHPQFKAGKKMEHKNKEKKVEKETYQKPEIKKEGQLKDITAVDTCS